MLIPVERNLTLYPGLQFDPLFAFFQDLAQTQPFALAGYTAVLTVGNAVLVLSTGSGLTVGTGTIQALATGAQTAAVPFGTYGWQLVWTPAGGQPDCPIAGQLVAQAPSNP